VARIELYVDGVVVARSDSPEPAEGVVSVTQIWRPRAPGEYVLQVRARNVAGVWGEYARVDVTVAEEQAVATVALAHGPTLTQVPKVLPSPTPTLTPTDTPAPTATPVPTGSPVPTSPPPTRTARAANPPAATETPVVIVVTATPAVAQAIRISGPTFCTAQFHYGESRCGPQQVTIEVKAATGSQVTSVRIYFMLADRASGARTRWSYLEMSRGDGKWARTITAADVPGHTAYRNAWFQFYFVATDSSGGQSKSPGYYTAITLSRCG
jgi:hypothetical protein